MRTTEPKNNSIKNNSKTLLTFLLSVLFTLNIVAKTNVEGDSLKNEMRQLEKILFTNVDYSSDEILDINDIEVIELEEEVEIGFDTAKHLPENFNPLKGKHDLDWNTIELVELEEDVELGFDTSKYLPKNFNALKGMHDLDWNTIELIELEEDVELEFDTSNYLPEDFNALKGMHDLDWSTIELIEIEEEVDIDFDTKAYLPEGFDPYKGMIKKAVKVVANH